MATRDAVYAAINVACDAHIPRPGAPQSSLHFKREIAEAQKQLTFASWDAIDGAVKDRAVRELLAAAAVIVRLLELHGVPGSPAVPSPPDWKTMPGSIAVDVDKLRGVPQP